MLKYWEEFESKKYEDHSRFGLPSEIANFPVSPLPRISEVLPIGLVDKDENTEMAAVLTE